MESQDIEETYKRLGCGPGVIELSTPFSQGEFMNTYHKFVKNTLTKPLLRDHKAEQARDGICAAVVMNWLATGSIPPQTDKMFEKLAEVQAAFEVDPELNYLKWHSNLSKFFPSLKVEKNSTDVDLNDRAVFIRFLTDNSGRINPNFKLLLILVFEDREGRGNHEAHAIGLNLKTKTFFDPNQGVFRIQSIDNPATDVAYAVHGLNKICEGYGNVIDVRAVTFT